MLLSEAVEEILEKAPNYLSMPSLIRKINTVRNQLLRTYGKEVVPYRMDINAGSAEYPWPLPPGSIAYVLVDGHKWPMGQLNAASPSHYYYLLAGTIGLYPVPQEAILQGLTIFYKKTLVPLSVGDLNAEVGLDPDYDNLVVYGVLKDITSGAQAAEYAARYEAALNDYLRTATSPEAYQIQLGEW